MARNGKGVLLKRNGTNVAEIQSVSFGGYSINVEDVTSSDSGSNYREFISTGWVDAGEITVSGNFLRGNTTQSTIISTDMEATAAQAYSVLIPGTTTEIAANAWPTNFSFEIPVDGVQTFSATLKITGKPTGM